MKAKEVELSNAWSGNSSLRQKFLDEFIKDSLHAEIAAIARYAYYLSLYLSSQTSYLDGPYGMILEELLQGF